MRSCVFSPLVVLLPWFGIVSSAFVDYPSVILPLRGIFNNQAASANGSADFDGHGSSFDSQQLPPGPWLFDGIKYDLPSTWGTAVDNVIANGQVVPLDDPTFVHELHFLYSGDASGEGEFVANFVLTFTDNSTQMIQLYAKNWFNWPNLNKGAIQTPFHFELNGMQKNSNTSQIYQWSTAVSSELPLKAITFPVSNVKRRLHLFGLSFSPSTAPRSSSPAGPALSIRRARFTSRWETINGKRAQAFEVTIANLLPTHLLAKNTSITNKHDISINGAGIRTVRPGSIFRLAPGDQARVDVFITGSKANGTAQVQVHDLTGKLIGSSAKWATNPLIEKWTADSKVLSTHETPTWWNQAKFGIFIHWGVYSYPAWAPNGTYAEWYNHDLHMPGSPTWNHHLQTFGKDVIYDDFIANFTASKFNASAWIDLFDRAGAKYFVLVTKHHDGYALFDTGNTTHRSSVHLSPKRDFVSELLETAKREKPDLHRGTYYSLPEWFNPDSARYGFGAWPGGLAHNAFNNSVLEPYTGRLEINDYIEDLQLPHMLTLALKYETEIMWCDIGGPNKTLEFASQFYNHAIKTDRQVTINNRCGAVPDFDTPEYATFGTIQSQSWESNEGMDPFSYGLNSATQANQYKNGSTIIQTLVDIVSKNGNYLLDVGPNAEGEIITPEANNLLDAGAWLKYSGECVYDTSYWFQGSQDDKASQVVRFTTTPKTFCIVAFSAPTNGQVVIQKRLPLLPGDKVKLLNPMQDGTNLPWSLNAETGELNINVSTSALASGRYAWAFQVSYGLE